jgi:phosphoglycolate phosphatase
MKNHTLIFDFDGTIADTHLFLVEIYNNYCREYGAEPIDVSRLEEYKDKNAAQIIKKLNVPFLKIPAMIARAKGHFHAHMEQIKTFPGIEEAIRALKKHGYTLGIVSSNTKDNIHKFLRLHQLDIFDFIHTTNRIMGKNVAIKKLMEELKILPERAIYIGDEIRDIEAGKKSGLKVIAVTWGYNLKSALAGYHPDHLVDSPQEMLRLIDGLS